MLANVMNATKRTMAQALRIEGFLLPYVALCAFCAVAAELAMEVWGFGFESAKTLLSESHAVLAFLLAASALVVVRHVVALLQESSGARDLRRRLRLQLKALPFAGRGVRFLALTAGLNFAFGVMAQCGEGTPDLDGDVYGWLISAVIVAILMAFTTRAILRRLPDIAAALVALFMRLLESPSRPHLDRSGEARSAVLDAWPPSCFNRPPPALQT